MCVILATTSPPLHKNNEEETGLTRILKPVQSNIIRLNQTILPSPYGDLLTSFIFGEANIRLPEKWKDTFKAVGLTHVLVVSGAQISLLDSSVVCLLKLLQIGLRAEIAALSGINLVFYGLTGGGASILRAVLMTQCGLVALYFGRRLSIWHIMTASAWVMMLIDPGFIWDIGAQLSFLATVSLVWAAPAIESVLPEKIPGVLKTTAAVSLAPFLLTTPILWFYFQNITLVSIVSNFFLLWIAELIVVTGFFSTVLGLIWQPLSLIGHHFCLALFLVLEKGSLIFKAVPWGHFFWPSPSLFFLMVLYATLGWFIVGLSRKNRTAIAASSLSFVFITGIIIWPAYAEDTYLKVLFINVGQGDSIFIQTPGKKNILIDTGNRTPFRDSGKQDVLPALHKLGVNSLDVLLLTHEDKDHIGGVKSITEKLPVKMLVDNGETLKKVGYCFNLNKTQYHAAVDGDRLNWNEPISFEIFHPAPGKNSNDSSNNKSVVVKLTYKEVSFLFTGDLEEIKERSILSHNLKSTVLKLGHHGSKTSSCWPFLKAVDPKIVVVSAGKNNVYHHPHPSVMNRIEKLGLMVFRTDMDGHILFLTDGKTLWFKTSKSRVLP